MKKFLGLAVLLGLSVSAHAAPRNDDVLELCKKFEYKSYAYSQTYGAEIAPTADGRSFTLWWQPEGFDAKKDIVFVSLHGHEGWATKGFQVWHPAMKEHKYAFLAVQWWYGKSADSAGYANPADIYPWIVQALEKRGIPRGYVILEGFSRGSANSYAVEYLDRRQRTPYFGLVISNSGAMERDFPPNRPFLNAPAGSTPFAGVNWILYCSEKDEQRKGACEKMRWTNGRLQAMGATVLLFFEDPVGQHGGFMAPEILDKALSVADQVMKGRISYGR